MHANAHTEIFYLVEVMFRSLIGKAPRVGTVPLGNMLTDELEDETKTGPHMRRRAEASATKCALGSVLEKVLDVGPPRYLTSKTGGKGAIAEQPMHTRAAQGQSHGEQAVERIGGHVCADTACNEHLLPGGSIHRLTPGAFAVTFQHAPLRQAHIAVAEFEVKEADGPQRRPSLPELAPFRQCTNPHDASATKRNFSS